MNGCAKASRSQKKTTEFLFMIITPFHFHSLRFQSILYLMAWHDDNFACIKNLLAPLLTLSRFRFCLECFSLARNAKLSKIPNQIPSPWPQCCGPQSSLTRNSSVDGENFR
jgi:hypothetical protein